MKNWQWQKNFDDGEVEIIDCGTAGTDLLLYLEDCSKLIIVDAIDAGQKEKEIVIFNIGDVSKFAKDKLVCLSLHDIGLLEILGLIRAFKKNIDIIIIGIKPKKLDFGYKLTPEIEKKIPEIVDLIKKEVGKGK